MLGILYIFSHVCSILRRISIHGVACGVISASTSSLSLVLLVYNFAGEYFVQMIGKESLTLYFM